MAHGPFIHREDSLPQRLGVDRNWLRKHRHPQSVGLKWDFGPNRAILWSSEGVQWLAQKLENSARGAAPEPAPPPENPAPLSSPWQEPAALLPERVGASAILTVTRTRFANPRVIQARTPWGQIVTVIGVKPPLWWPGFLLQAREHSQGVWEFECNPQNPAAGRRQPRGKTDPVWPRCQPLPGPA